MEMTIEKQKEVADKVLDALFTVQPHTIAAGGAPRDWLDDKLASDIDVFVDLRHISSTNKINELLDKAGLTEFITGEAKHAEGLPEHYRKNPDIRCVYNLVIHGVDVQLIIVNCPCWKVVEQFPFPVCQCWYKNGKIESTKEYKLCKLMKALVITNPVYGHQDLYVKKIKEKFPDYSWYASMEGVKEAFISKTIKEKLEG